MIRVSDVSFKYPGQSKYALDKVSFNISEGSIFGFLGPSGSGKSTMQKILYKVLEKFEGEIEINKSPLKSLGSDYKSSIGVGFELPNHYEKLSGKENLSYFASLYPYVDPKYQSELIETVGLSTDIDRKVGGYSKGMKMRLNFVRALQHNPSLIFLDEPTAGLDPGNARIIKDKVLQLKEEGKTVFITTHNMNTADELCDSVAFITEGRLQVIDSPSNLKEKYGNHKLYVTSSSGDRLDFPLMNIGINTDFLAFIKENEIISIESDNASLEQVFLAVTGSNLSS